MSEIVVSVCIATYNQENYIRKCLDSVFMQKTNFNFEVIVGEDASPDNTREILLEYKEKYGDKLVLLLHDKNLGPSGNTRSIQEKVRGKYIAAVEGDDFWTDEYKLQKQYDILESNPQYSAVCSDFMGVSPEGEIFNPSVFNLKKDTVKTMKDWLREGYTLHTCTVFRRNIFPVNDEKYRKLVTAEPTMGDLITFTLLYDAGDIYVIKDVMSAHRSAGEKDVASFTYTQRTKAIEYTYMLMRIIRNIEEYLEYKYDLSPIICNRIALVKLQKIRGTVTYRSYEMHKLMKTISFKMRMMMHYRLVKKIFKSLLKKMRSCYAR